MIPPQNPDATIPTLAHDPHPQRPLPPQPPPPQEPKQRRDFAAPPEIDGPARVQMIVAAVLALVLIAIPLFLLGRPRTIGDPIAPGPESSASADAFDDGVNAHAAEDAGLGLVISDLKVSSCHDPGAKKTSPEQCDNPEGLDAIVKSAIRDSASCVSGAGGGGAIAYGLDVSFTRKKSPIGVAALKDGRTLKNARAPLKCASAIHEKLESQSLDSIKHEHVRYRMSIVATYPGPV